MIKENELLHGYCNPKCIFHELREIPCYTNDTHKTIIDICNFNGSARSFGCMNGCLNGSPQLEPLTTENEQTKP